MVKAGCLMMHAMVYMWDSMFFFPMNLCLVLALLIDWVLYLGECTTGNMSFVAESMLWKFKSLHIISWKYFLWIGDVNSISVGSGTNIQDNSLVHVAKSNLSGKVLPTIIGDNVTVGEWHGCVFYHLHVKCLALVFVWNS